MNKEFLLTILALDELKELGYKEVWIGDVENPHWPSSYRNKNFIIASPKSFSQNWPALWYCSEKNFGKMSCGNGLAKADQAQRSHCLMIGHYQLRDEKWEVA